MSRTKRSKRDVEPEDDDDDDERMPYFVPEEGIDIEPLALYTRSILDQDANVKLGNHPQRTNEKGFWIISSVAVSREDIAAMIEDTRLWKKEGKKGHYVHSETAKRRMRLGRAQQGRDRASMAQPRVQKETEDPRYARQGVSRASVEPPDPRFMPPPPVTRSSADSVTMSGPERSLPATTPSPRPASAQPAQLDTRRPSAASQYPSNVNPGYTISAAAQYTVQANISNPIQYASYGADTAMYDAAPPPYRSNDSKRGGDGSQPSTTGTQGFQSSYATAGGPPKPRAPANQGQRRHGP